MDTHRYRALLIGNSTFPNDSNNLQALKGPINDLALMKRALCDGQAGLFAEDDVTVLPERTTGEILMALEQFFGSARRDDKLFLYYTGHGRLNQRNRLFLCGRDTRTDLLVSTAVGADDVNNMFDQCAAQTTVIVLDCCHSGAFKGGSYTRSLSGTGRFVLTSCRSSELSMDTDATSGASVFTAHLAEGVLRGAVDNDGDGYIDLDDVYDYVYAQLGPGKQIPEQNFQGRGAVAIGRRAPRIESAVAAAPPPPSPPRPAPGPPAEPAPSGGRRSKRLPVIMGGVIGVVVVAIVAALAFGGGGGGSSSSASPTTSTPLESLVVIAADVPADWTSKPAPDAPENTSFSVCVNPPSRSNWPKARSDILTSPDGKQSVSYAVWREADPGKAYNLFDAYVERYLACARANASDFAIGGGRLRTVDRLDISSADGVRAAQYRFVIDVPTGSSTTEYDVDALLFQYKDLEAEMTFNSAGAPVAPDLKQAVLDSIGGRLAAAS